MKPVLTTPKALRGRDPHPMRGPGGSIRFYPLHPIVGTGSWNLHTKDGSETWARMPWHEIEQARRHLGRMSDDALRRVLNPWRGLEQRLSRAEAMVLAEEVARRWAKTKTAVATWARRD